MYRIFPRTLLVYYNNRLYVSNEKYVVFNMDMIKNKQKKSRNKKSPSTVLSGLTVLTVLLVILGIGTFLLLRGLGRYLVVDATPGTAVDAVAVLSGEYGQERLEEAAKIYHNGYTKIIILTETGETLPGGTVLVSSTKSKDLAERLNVPDSAILITEKTASSTWGEARVVMKLMLKYNLQTCIVVTDPYHTRRALMVFKDEFTPRGLSAYVYPAGQHWYDAANWWRTEESRSATLSEYLKMAAYVLGFKQN